MAVGLVVAVGALRTLPTGAAIAVAVVAIGASVAAVTWPVGGRTGDEWAPDLARHARRVALGRRWRAPRTPTGSPFQIHGSDTSRNRGRRSAGPRNRGPRSAGWPSRGPFSTLRILQVESGDERGAVRITQTGSRRGSGSGTFAAVVHDAAERTYTAVIPASGPGFVLLASDERDRRVAGWAAALGALARQGTPVHRVQWVARTLPGGPDRPGPDRPATGPISLHGTTGPAGSPADSPMGSYEELLGISRPELERHQVFLAMSVRGGRTNVALRPAGAQDHANACAVLLRELAAFRRRLAEADVDTAPALAPRVLASVLRAGFSSSRWSWPDECGTTWPWPVAGEVLWDSLRLDGTWHATYWVAEWPRTDVAADFLGPLLLAGDVRQTVSVTMEPLSPFEAQKRVQQARTADVADSELRRRGGFLHTARRKREEETLAERELELADGHAPFKFSGYVTVSSDDRDDLEASCGRVEQAAGRCGMELRRCFGDQQNAFTFSLPLCRGLA